MAHSLRSVGSAAINIALVACGSLDMYWEIGVSIVSRINDGGADIVSVGPGM